MESALYRNNILSTLMTALTPLEPWIREKACISPALTGMAFTETLEAYQLSKINEVIDYARRNTAFYRNHLAFVGGPLKNLSDIAMIPFTKPSDLSQNPFDFLAVRQDEVARIVTLRTSGSTGEAKRLFFTEADLELTIDFFHHGMSTLVQPGQKVAVLLPGEKPDSVGDLLRRGLLRMDIDVLPVRPCYRPDPRGTRYRLLRGPLSRRHSHTGTRRGMGKQKLKIEPGQYKKHFVEHRLCAESNHGYFMRDMGLPRIQSLRHDRDGTRRRCRLRGPERLPSQGSRPLF